MGKTDRSNKLQSRAEVSPWPRRLASDSPPRRRSPFFGSISSNTPPFRTCATDTASTPRCSTWSFANSVSTASKEGKSAHSDPNCLGRCWSAAYLIMPGIVEFPTVVRDAVARYGDFFANDCQRRHFAEYLTGLIVAQRKTVLGIHEAFAHTTDQSCLNRFLTEVAWDAERLNERRLELLQEDPTTRYSDQGVIPIDNTLIDRDGFLIPDAGWYWDHAEERNKIAQDYLFVNYVCTSGKHYPLEFRLFRKEEICEALKEPFRNHTALCCELIDWVCERQIPGDFAMDC